jgi:hypothetical protein
MLPAAVHEVTKVHFVPGQLLRQTSEEFFCRRWVVEEQRPKGPLPPEPRSVNP